MTVKPNYLWCDKRECRIHIDICLNTSCRRRKKCQPFNDRGIDGNEEIPRKAC